MTHTLGTQRALHKGGAKEAPLIMGILNVTPDSFSDGGRYQAITEAVEHAAYLIDCGADIVDVGAESSRPGARPISVDEEWQRLEPVLQALQPLRQKARLSVDTQKPEVMLRAASVGIDMINDVGGRAKLADLRHIAKYPGLHYVGMHMHGTPQTMQQAPLKASGVCAVIEGFFQDTLEKAGSAGLDPSHVWLDPGIGFGKTDAANVAILGALGSWTAVYRLAVGVSRKSLMGRLLGIESPEDRDPPSKMLELGLALMGVQLIRTHDVASLRRLTQLMQGDD